MLPDGRHDLDPVVKAVLIVTGAAILSEAITGTSEDNPPQPPSAKEPEPTTSPEPGNPPGSTGETPSISPPSDSNAGGLNLAQATEAYYRGKMDYHTYLTIYDATYGSDYASTYHAR